MKISKEWKFVMLWAALVVLLANIPYIYGYVSAPDGKQFMGDARTFIDTNTYLAWMQQAVDGHFLFKDMYTTEPHSRIFFHPLFLSLGLIAKITGFSPLSVHTMARVVFGFASLLFLYLFISFFIKETNKRAVAFALLSLSGGFGWLKLIPQIDAINESWFLIGWVEGNTFLSIYALPLFSASLLLLAATFYFILRAFEENKPIYAFVSGIICFFLVLTHFFDALIVYPVLVAYIAALYFIEQNLQGLKKRIKLFLIFFACSIVAPVYDLFASLANPVFFTHAWKQAVTLSPNFIWYIGGAGFIGIFALIGILFILGQRTDDEKAFNRFALLITWALTIPFLVYMPISFQRRLVEGVHVPLTILATVGLFALIEKLHIKNWKAVCIVFLIITIPNSINVLGRDMNYLAKNAKSQTMAGYLDLEIAEAFGWLRQNSDRDDAVLSDYETGNYIPGFSGNRVFIGHPEQTIDFDKKWQATKMFFDDKVPDDLKKKMIREAGIEYVFYGWKEARLGQFDPNMAEYLEPAFSNQKVTIFKVVL